MASTATEIKNAGPLAPANLTTDIQKISAKSERLLDVFGKDYEHTRQSFDDAKMSLSADGVSKVTALAALEHAKENKGFSVVSLSTYYRHKSQSEKDPKKVQAGRQSQKSKPERALPFVPPAVEKKLEQDLGEALHQVFVEINPEFYATSKPVADNEARVKIFDNLWAMFMTARHKDLIVTIDPATRGIVKVRIAES
jgi:hypothetical protein